MRPIRILALAVLLLSACHREPPKSTHRWFAMDTDLSAVVFDRGEPKRVPVDGAFQLLEKESARLESVFSDYLPGSNLIKLIGRKGDTLVTTPEIIEVFTAAQAMASASRGSFDITLHRLKSAWGLASGDTPRVPDSSALAQAMRGNPAFHAPADSNPALHPPFAILPGDRIVLLRDSAVFDLGGIAKGYVVDRLHAVLDSLGYPNHIVSAGGDLRVSGSKGEGEAWKLGIRHPRLNDSLAGKLTLPQGLAVSTSGDYERFFIKDGVRYHHIFDPRTGAPARPWCSVTVLTPSSFLSDRLTKPLFILGPEKSAELLRRFGARAVWMKESGPGPTDVCYVESEGMQGIAAMKVPPCAQPR